MITKPEKEVIRQLLQDPRWQTIEKIAYDIQEKIESESIVMDTEWDAAKSVLLKEGQKRGINRLIQELYALAQHE